LQQNKRASYPQGFKANLGLELANAFSVRFKLQQYLTENWLALNDIVTAGTGSPSCVVAESQAHWLTGKFVEAEPVF
jgi:hypothetical protein